MINLIPDFKPGDRVIVKEQPFEKPKPCCNKRVSCVALFSPIEATIIEKKEAGAMQQCGACGAILPSPENYWRIKSEGFEKMSVPYTWLTPLGESHD